MANTRDGSLSRAVFGTGTLWPQPESQPESKGIDAGDLIARFSDCYLQHGASHHSIHQVSPACVHTCRNGGAGLLLTAERRALRGAEKGPFSQTDSELSRQASLSHSFPASCFSEIFPWIISWVFARQEEVHPQSSLRLPNTSSRFGCHCG